MSKERERESKKVSENRPSKHKNMENIKKISEIGLDIFFTKGILVNLINIKIITIIIIKDKKNVI